MHSFSEYLNSSSPEPHISNFFKSAGPTVAARLTLENFDFELNAINEFENLLPNSFDLHLDMILTGGSTLVSQYYHDLASGKEKMFEKIRESVNSSDFEKINESLKSLHTVLKEKYSHLIEQAAIDFDSKFGDITNDAVIDAALKGAPETTADKSKVISMLKDLWNGLTDDGDWLSVSQLLLDIVGIFDPFGVADGINAMIYFARGRPVLGLISVIAAVIPYGGDSLKLLKLGKTGKYAEEVVMYTIKGGRGAAQKALKRIPVKDRGPVMKALSYIVSVLPSAMSKTSAAISSFFGKYLAKYTKWIPGMENFFNGIAKRFSGYAKKMDDLVKDLKYAQGTLIKASKATADLAKAAKRGAKMEIDSASGLIRLYNAEGKVIREFSEEFLKKSKFWRKLGTNPIVRNVSTAEDLVKYYNGIAKVTPSLFSSVAKIFSVIHKGAVGSFKFTLFVGKQIIKMATGQTAEELGIPDEQSEFYGADFLNNAVQKKIDEERKKGVNYPAVVTFDSANDEDYQTITKYQNDWAKIVGGPEVIPVMYDKFGDAELKQEFNDFWSKVGKGEIKRDASGNLIKGEPAPVNKVVKEVPNLRSTDWYREAFPQVPNESRILSFSKFIND
jgi:hypothetical protein